MSKNISLVVRPDGELQCLYNEELDLSVLGPHVYTHRASHVETRSNLSSKATQELYMKGWYRPEICQRVMEATWWADLSPVNGPILGPFNKRSLALEAEAEWIRENVLKAKR